MYENKFIQNFDRLPEDGRVEVEDG